MPSDDVTLNAGTGGAVIRTLADTSGNEWPASVVCYATSVSPGANVLQVVTASVGLPVAQQGPWTVTADAGSGTFAISAVALPLPVGAATSAKQPRLGVAGSPGFDVITVQGCDSMTPFVCNGELGQLAIEGGNLATIAGAITSGNVQANIAQLHGNTPDTNSGLKSSGTLRVVLATDQPALTHALTVDNSGNVQPVSGTFWQTTQPVSGSVTANAGTNLNTSTLAKESGGNLATIANNLPSQGQALAAASMPVVLTAAQITTLTPLSTVAVTGTFWQATQPVSGTVTANAGTNMSTAALALETGGNLATLAATVSSTKVNANVTQATAGNLNATVVGTGTFVVQAAQSGTWNVGTVTTVTTVTTVAAVTAITNALPAGTNLLGQISASHETATIYNGTTALTPKFAVITASSSGATTVVAAVGGKRIRVLKWSLSSNGAVNVKWQSHVTPTDITGLHYLTQFASAGGAYCPVGHFQTVSGEALDINLSGAVAVGGELTYVEV